MFKPGQIWKKGDKLHYLLVEYIESVEYIQLATDERWKVNCIETGRVVSLWMNPQIDVFIQEG